MDSTTPKTAILLATYNGQSFLKEQLDSFSSQTLSSWNLFVSDDGSKDNTFKLLNEFSAHNKNHTVVIKNGPHKGFAANFLSMVCDNDIIQDYYAYADQDDIWENDKLERALHWLEKIPKNTPALYCTRTRLVDENNHAIGFSPLFKKKPSFENALVQSISGGNTMVFNHAARILLQKFSQDIDVKSHDWWSYMVITGCGGKIFYDTYCSLRYRQHSANLTGMNTSLSAKFFRIRMLLQGRFKNWNTQNTTALLKNKELLTPENQKILGQFILARNSKFAARITGLIKIKVYRQTFFGNIGLIVAAIFNKI